MLCNVKLEKQEVGKCNGRMVKWYNRDLVF